MNKLLVGVMATIMVVCAQMSSAQDFALKTNLLYGATKTPNLGVEFGLGKKTTLEFTGGYNPWNLDGKEDGNKKLVHWLGQSELRYWPCARFNGSFFGLHVLGTQYNISKQNLDFIFGKDSKLYRFEGWGAGAGISYGYHWILSNRFSIEATVGVGAVKLVYDNYQCPKCGEKIDYTDKMYYGPTKAGISLVYMIK